MAERRKQKKVPRVRVVEINRWLRKKPAIYRKIYKIVKPYLPKNVVIYVGRAPRSFFKYHYPDNWKLIRGGAGKIRGSNEWVVLLPEDKPNVFLHELLHIVCKNPRIRRLVPREEEEDSVYAVGWLLYYLIKEGYGKIDIEKLFRNRKIIIEYHRSIGWNWTKPPKQLVEKVL